ncbi:hypothetical protein FU976_08030 [Campylobacter jejuni]|nr:hypothetical protein [Campylobacter jejuni]
MDIISYGIANKAGASEKKTRDTTLAAGIQGKHPNIKSRIDSLEKAFEGLTLKANQMIVNDAINIMKANAKLNAIAKTTRYKMQNMFFDDLLNLSGIDTVKSNGYIHDPIIGTIKGGTIITTIEIADAIPAKAILSVEADGEAVYFISRDAGTTWQKIQPDTLFYFDEKVGTPDKNIQIKAELPANVTLLNYALTWA